MQRIDLLEMLGESMVPTRTVNNNKTTTTTTTTTTMRWWWRRRILPKTILMILFASPHSVF
jgi:hypothetical protein